MCGLIFVKRLDARKANKMTAKRYRRQKSRGQEGFGFIAIENGKIAEYKRTQTEKEILDSLELQTASEILFHHRFPTSTPNFANSAHPIKVSHPTLKYDYYLIHNGIIFGDDELKEQHEALGFIYNTKVECTWTSQGNTVFSEVKWNDSEALAIELARNLDIGGEGIDVEGSIAFICLQVHKETKQVVKLFFGHNSGSPLLLDKSKKQFITLTSEGHGETVKVDQLYSLDYATNKISHRDYKIGQEYKYTGYTTGYTFTKEDSEENYKYPELVDDSMEINDGDDYFEALKEYNELQRKLAKRTNKDNDDEEYLYLEARLADLDAELRAYEKGRMEARLDL